MTRWLAALLLCLHAILALAADSKSPVSLPLPLPALTARVTDLTGTLVAGDLTELETKLTTFEARKGSQVTLLVLPTTQPETIEQFGVRLFEAWKIGRKEADDGVILIVAKDDQRLRIEVGYGLEGVLNDATAKRIIDETIAPHFKAGDLAGGIKAGIDAILVVVDTEQLPPTTDGPVSDSGGSQSLGDLGFDAFNISEGTFMIGLGGAAVGGAALRFFLGNVMGSAIIGVLAAILGGLLSGTLVGALIGAAVGFFVALFGLDLLLSGVFGGGGSGGSSGGGGFSGGGGSSGGGGASGSW
jgi:uncharacterized protein